MKAMLIGLGHIAQVHIKCLIHLNIDIIDHIKEVTSSCLGVNIDKIELYG